MHRCRVVRSWPLTGVDEAGGGFGNYLSQSRFSAVRMPVSGVCDTFVGVLGSSRLAR